MWVSGVLLRVGLERHDNVFKGFCLTFESNKVVEILPAVKHNGIWLVSKMEKVAFVVSDGFGIYQSAVHH